VTDRIGTDGPEDLFGSEGADSLAGLGGNDQLFGYADDDTLLGGDGDDKLDGGEGSDRLEGGLGNDAIITGNGDDIVFGGDGQDTVNGEPRAGGKFVFWPASGRLQISGGAGDDFLYGGTGPDQIAGDEGSDTLKGADGNDQLSGGPGDDNLEGGAGDDLLDGGPGNDRLISGEGRDTIVGGDGNDEINGYIADDDTYRYWNQSGPVDADGGAGDDFVYGSSGPDTLKGGSGDDILYAGPGNDRLDGGAGADELFGQGGDDYYVVDHLGDSVTDSQGNNSGLIRVDFYKKSAGVSWTLDQGVKPIPYWIDALVEGGNTAFDAHQIAKLGVIKYGFPQAPLASWSASDAAGFTPFNAAQRAFIKDTFAYISSVINVRFEEVQDTSAPRVLSFGNNTQSGSAGYATGSFGGTKWAVLLNNSGTSARGNLAPAEGDYAALTIVHEIGHALGLKHPHSRTAGESVGSEPPYLTAAEDRTTFTQMSYTESPEDFYIVFRDLDIAALQYLYGPAQIAGARPNQAGDTVYTLTTSWTNFIWDGGGVDSIDASDASLRVSLSLEAGTHSYFGAAQANLITAPGQITINIGTLIENAKGTAFADEIVGNIAPNSLDGGAGDDSLFGGLGNDVLTGGLGNDLLDGGVGEDGASYVGASGAIRVDLAAGTATWAMGDDRLVSIERIWAGDYADTLFGSAGADYFIPAGGDDQIDGREGVDGVQINADFEACLIRFEADVCLIEAPKLGIDRLTNIERVVFVGTTVVEKTMADLRALVPLNQPPSFAQDIQRATTLEDEALSLTLGASDRDGDTLTYEATQGAHGTTRILGNVVTYTPSPNFNGTDSFTVTALDAKGAKATQRVELIITPVNDAPTFADPTQIMSLVAGASSTVTLFARDVDGDSLRYSVSAPERGSVTLIDNKLTYQALALASGSDRLTVTAEDNKGAKATQILQFEVSALAIAAPKTSFRLTAPDGWVGAVGGNGLIFGSAGSQDVTLLFGAITLDASFNRGADVVRFEGNASAFTVARSGSSAQMSAGSALVASLPVGTQNNVISFADGAHGLSFTVGAMRLGGQILTGTPAPIEAPLAAAAAPTLDLIGASARVSLLDAMPGSQSAQITLSGTATIYGTPGADRVALAPNRAAQLTFDASFNKGGDLIILGKEAAQFEATRTGSSITISSAGQSLLLPVGTAGTTLRFADGDRTLIFAEGACKIGSQVIEATKSALSPFTNSVSLDVGTSSQSLGLSGAGGAIRFEDDAGRDSFVVLTNFSFGDLIAVRGATESQYSFSSRDLDGDGVADDLAISYSDPVSGAVNDIEILNILSPTAFVQDRASAIAAVGFNFISFG
jgi:Ca2+-binding RTX toxin-like protein